MYSNETLHGSFMAKYTTCDQNKLWPPRSNLTSEAKLKISNGHSLENMIDIKTISFLQSPLVKYATFDSNELWPTWSNLTSEAKLEILNMHSLEAIILIRKISIFVKSFHQMPTFSWPHEFWPLMLMLTSEVKFKDLKYPLLKSYKSYYNFFPIKILVK